MLATGLRIAEVAEHRMSHIREAALVGEKIGWRCDLRGKGDKPVWGNRSQALSFFIRLAADQHGKTRIDLITQIS